MNTLLYKFKCIKCNEDIQLEIAMKDYKRDSYKCEKCGEILKRDVNDICSTFDTSKITGFFGKSNRKK